jgi:lipopolysaccharide exporter
MKGRAASLYQWGGLSAARGLNILLGFAISVFLMRKLGPGPFGLVAMVDGMLAVLGAVGDAGIGASLISDPERRPGRSAAAVVTALGLGVVLSLCLLAVTPLVTAYYHVTDIRPIWLVLVAFGSVALVQTVPSSLAQVSGRFAGIGLAELATTVLAGLVAVAATWWRVDVWPIVFRRLVQLLVTPVAMWLVARPQLARPSRADFGAILGFGRGVVGFNLLNALNRNADNLIIGRYLGSEALGLYGLAYRVLMFPMQQVGGIIQTIAYPTLAKEIPDWHQIASKLGRLLAEMLRFVTPLGIGVALAGGDLVHVVFGAQWDGAVVPVRILGVLLIYQAPFAQLGMAYLLSRETGRMARWAMIATPAIVASFFLGLPWGLVGVATSYALVSLALAPALVRWAAGSLSVPASMLARPAVAAFLQGLRDSVPLAAAWFLAQMLGFPPPTRLAVVVIAGGVTWAIIGWRRAGRWDAEGFPTPSFDPP